MTDHSWGLLLSFSGLYPTMPEEHAFVHGFEFGEIWTRMRGGHEAEIEGTFHTANRTILERACAAGGWNIEIDGCTDESGKTYGEWMTVKMQKAKAASANPHGLRVVSALPSTATEGIREEGK